MTTTTTASIATPTWGTIPAGSTVTVTERIPGHFLVAEGRRTSALMTAEQLAAVVA